MLAPEAKTKIESAYAYIPLFRNEQIIDIYRTLKRALNPDNVVKWQDTPTYHITLCYVNDFPESGFEIIHSDVPANALMQNPIDIVGYELDTFDTPDGYALHLKLELTDTLKIAQQMVFDVMQSIGDGVSPFSIPESYHPHITIAYLKENIGWQGVSANITDIANEIVIGRDQYDPHIILKAPELKSRYEKGLGVMASIQYDHVQETEEGLIVPVIGIPFGGPLGGKDIGNDYFDRDTYVGDLQVVHAYFDHGRADQWIADEVEKMKSIGDLPGDFTFKGFGRHLIGYAEKGITTESGILYNIIVKRRHHYYDLIKKLVENHIVDASSRSLARIDDPDHPGRIQEWHVGAVDLTPAPVNPYAQNLYKSIVEDLMKPDTTVKPIQIVSEPGSVTPAAETPPTLAEQVVAAFDSEVSGDHEKSVSSIADAFGQLLSQNATLIEQNAALIANSQAQDARVNNLEKSLADITLALPEIARSVAKQLTMTVKEHTEKSLDELDAEKLARSVVKNRMGALPSDSVNILNQASGAPGF